MPAAGRRALGSWGEDLAAAWYLAHGYEVVDRNWSCRSGELDIVARRGSLHVFCEVKARSSVAFGPPAEAVGALKQARLRRLAAMWFAAQCPASPDSCDPAGAGRGDAEPCAAQAPGRAQEAGPKGPSGAPPDSAGPADDVGRPRGPSSAPPGRSGPGNNRGRRGGPVRFDVASVLAGAVEVIEGAF